MSYNTAPFEPISSKFSNSPYTSTAILGSESAPNSKLSCKSPVCLGLSLWLSAHPLATLSSMNRSARFAIRQKEVISEKFPIRKSEATRGRLRVNMYLKPKISLLNTQPEKPSKLISCLLFLGVRYSKKTNF